VTNKQQPIVFNNNHKFNYDQNTDIMNIGFDGQTVNMMQEELFCMLPVYHTSQVPLLSKNCM